MAASIFNYYFDDPGSGRQAIPNEGDRSRRYSVGSYMNRAQYRTIGGGDYTISLWVRTSDRFAGIAGLGQGLISMTNDDLEDQYFMSMSDSQIHWGYWDTAGDDPTGLMTVDFGPLNDIWLNLVFRRAQDGTRSIHGNGSVEAPFSLGATGAGFGDRQFELGRIFDVGDSYLRGRLDEIVIWPRLLEQYEIRNLYNGGAGILRGNPSFPANAVNHWPQSQNDPGGAGQDIVASFNLTDNGTHDAEGIRISTEQRDGFIAAAL